MRHPCASRCVGRARLGSASGVLARLDQGGEVGVEQARRLLLAAGEQVAVEVERDLDVGVASAPILSARRRPYRLPPDLITTR